MIDTIMIAVTGGVCSSLTAIVTFTISHRSKLYRGMKSLLRYRVYDLSSELSYRMKIGEIPETEEMQNLDDLYVSYSKDFKGNGIAQAKYEKAIELYKHCNGGTKNDN